MAVDRAGGNSPRPQIRNEKAEAPKKPVETTKKNEIVKAEAKPLKDAFGVQGQVQTKGTAKANVQDSGPFSILNRAADAFGGAVRQGGQLIERGGQLLEGRVPGGSELRDLGEAAQQVGRGIQDAPEVAVATATAVQGQVNGMVQQGQQIYQRAEAAAQPLIAQGVETLRTGLDNVRSGLDTLKNGVTDFVKSITEATNFGTNIDKLGTGDKYTLGLGGSASVEGAKVYGAGQIEVSKGDDGAYTVAVDGKVGGGIYGQLGASVGGKAEASGEATLGVGGKVEFKFATAEEAKRATEVLLRQAAVSAVASSPAGIAAGPLAQQAIGPSAEDLKFLGDNISALELRGEAAAKIGGELGLGERGVAVAGAFGEAKVETVAAARIEFEKGKPPTLVVKQDYTGEVSAGVKAGLDYSNGAPKNPNEASLLPSLGGSAKGTVSVESRITLPSNINVANLKQDPLGTIKAAGVEMGNSAQSKVTVTLEGNGQAVGTGGGMEAKVEFSAKPADLMRSGAIQQALAGNFEGAFKAAGDKTEVKASLTPFTKHGVSLSPEVSIMGFGVGLEGQAVRQDMADKPLWEFKGNATQAGQGVDKFLKDHPELVEAARASASTAAQLAPFVGIPIRG